MEYGLINQEIFIFLKAILALSNFKKTKLAATSGINSTTSLVLIQHFLTSHKRLLSRTRVCQEQWQGGCCSIQSFSRPSLKQRMK